VRECEKNGTSANVRVGDSQKDRPQRELQKQRWDERSQVTNSKKKREAERKDRTNAKMIRVREYARKQDDRERQMEIGSWQEWRGTGRQQQEKADKQCDR
jgi:hypothetical protein